MRFRWISTAATREEEIDRMLRAGLFVDLYQVVRQSLRASVESYSIKRLSHFTDSSARPILLTQIPRWPISK